MTKLLSFGLLFFLTACLDSKYPTHTKKHEGVTMTCVTDSTTLMTDTIIKIKAGIFVGKSRTCVNCRYNACANKPIYFDFTQDWPSRFVLDFRKGQYYFMNNPRPFDPGIKYGEDGFSVRYDLDFGPLKYNKKSKTITIESVKYKIKRTYTYEYTHEDSVLTLKRKNSY